MLRQEELAFIKAISTLQLSPALLRELRMALLHRKKKPVEPQHHVYRWGHSLPNIPVKVG
jgi:DNA-binding HxlR family transcriptional regulator